VKTYLAINTSLAHSSRKKLHPELYFKILFSKEDCTAEKGTEKRKMVFVREIYFEKNTVE
jgi:hypothetical protein